MRPENESGLGNLDLGQKSKFSRPDVPLPLAALAPGSLPWV